MDDPLDLLDDLETWRAASPTQQDAAVAAAVGRLGPGWRHEVTASYARGGQAHRTATLLHERSGAALQLLPGGRYRRGKPEDLRADRAHNDWSEDKLGYVNPRPLVRDEVVRPFLLGVAPLEEDPGAGPLLVSWGAARRRLEATPPLRLPSEAEWEWGCRAGGSTPAEPRGPCADLGPDRSQDDVGLVRGSAQGAGPGPAPGPGGRPKPERNAFGLEIPRSDLWEWVGEEHVCTYRWKPDMSEDEARGDPGSDVYHVLRGNGCDDFVFVLHASDGEPVHHAPGEDLGAVRVATSLPRAYRPDRAFEPGERLVHAKFGPGVALSVRGRKLEVLFDDGQARTLAHGGQ